MHVHVCVYENYCSEHILSHQKLSVKQVTLVTRAANLNSLELIPIYLQCCNYILKVKSCLTLEQFRLKYRDDDGSYIPINDIFLIRDKIYLKLKYND